VSSFEVYAVSRDDHWIRAVGEACQQLSLVTTSLLGISEDELGTLGARGRVTLVLIDTWGRSDIVGLVRSLQERGWRYAVAVTAAPTAREARALLKVWGAYDYWCKTYSTEAIRVDLIRLAREISPACCRGGARYRHRSEPPHSASCTETGP
jgi:hypothetical protein